MYIKYIDISLIEKEHALSLHQKLSKTHDPLLIGDNPDVCGFSSLIIPLMIVFLSLPHFHLCPHLSLFLKKKIKKNPLFQPWDVKDTGSQTLYLCELWNPMRSESRNRTATWY